MDAIISFEIIRLDDGRFLPANMMLRLNILVN
jgi:hypothetical protein